MVYEPAMENRSTDLFPVEEINVLADGGLTDHLITELPVGSAAVAMSRSPLFTLKFERVSPELLAVLLFFLQEVYKVPAKATPITNKIKFFMNSFFILTSAGSK